MKRFKILSLLVLLMTGGLYSCFEDKGNYNYTWVPDVTIESGEGGFSDKTIKRGQHLTIEPKLRLLQKLTDGSYDTMAFDEGQFTYRWTAYQSSLLKPVTELATTRNLDTAINLPLITDPYTVVYTVTQKNSGVSYNFTFSLKVEVRWEYAWMFLVEDEEGMADLTLYGKEVGIEKDTSIYETNVLKNSGFPYCGGGAKFVYYYEPKRQVFVGTGGGCGWLNRDDGLMWSDKQMMRYRMVDLKSINYTFDNIVRTDNMDMWHFVASDGWHYPLDGNDIVLSPYNILPPTVTGKSDYDTVRMSPYIGGRGGKILVFNEDDKMMMRYNGTRANYIAGKYAVTLPVEDRIANHQLYFMQIYGTDNTVVLAKNLEDNKYYSYIYDKTPKKINTREIINGELIGQATFFECDYVKGFCYMVVGNKLYALENDEFKEVYIVNSDGLPDGAFNGFEGVTALTRYTDINSTRAYIMLATYADGEAQSGKVYFLEPNPTKPSELTIRVIHEKLGRVKSISRFG